MFVKQMPFNFKFLTHGHSHVAMLGWVYMALFLLFIKYFAGEFNKSFNRLFWLTEIAVLVMIISFPVQGYALFSIIASSLYIVFSYFFTALMLKNAGKEKSAAHSLMRTSLIWLCLSTLSLWALGPIIATTGSSSKPAMLTIQYFLHFQLNGWFMFAAMALFFKFLKIPDSKDFKIFHLSFIISVVLTFGLSVNWYYDYGIFRFINNLGIVSQLIAFFYGFKLIKTHGKEMFRNLGRLSKILLIFIAVSITLKTLFQSVSVVPEIARDVFNNRQAVIGFIHLMMLGIISTFLFFCLKLDVKKGESKKLLSIGIVFFLIGIIASEFLLLYQGLAYYLPEISISDYAFWLAIFSCLLPAGIYMALISSFDFEFMTKKNKDEKDVG